MKTFLEYNDNNNTDVQIEQLAYTIAELGINPLEIIGKMSENIISKLDNQDDKRKVALIEQEIVEGIGDWLGKTAGKIRSQFSDIGKGYKQARADYQRQQAPPLSQGQTQQAQIATNQAAQPVDSPYQSNNPQMAQTFKVLQSFKNNLEQAGLSDTFAPELQSMQQKFIQMGQEQ